MTHQKSNASILSQPARGFRSFLTNTQRKLRETIPDRSGFTLIELIIVVSILSLIAALVAPRFVNIFGGGKGDMITFTSVIAKTFDNAFLREESCFLAIHSVNPDTNTDINDPNGILSRENGVSVVVYNPNGYFEDTKNRNLPHKRFSSTFRIEEIILSNGEKITKGTVLIPFSTDGFSADAIIHVLSGNDRYSVVIYRLRKEPRVFPDYIEFDAVRNGEVL